MTDKPTVAEAWSAVMGDVQAVKKGDRNKQQGFDVRGIDSVMNAVGRVLRKHGVTVLPEAQDIITSSYNTKSGTTMYSAVVKVRFTVYGPAGDHFSGCTYGEASDAGDKAVSKAHSVAYRTFLLQGLTIPTDEPDPDAESHQRAAEPKPGPAVLALGNAVVNRGLSAPQKQEFRAKLAERGLPQSAKNMSEDEAVLAQGVLDELFPVVPA